VQDSDYGGIITFSNAAATTVTLNPAVRQFWFAALENLGVGAVTITPGFGTLNGLGSTILTTNMGIWIFYDGSNWWAMTVPIQPVGFAVLAHEFLTSYNSTTGLFTAAQPVIADVSGLSAALALLAPIANPTFTGTVTQPNAPVLTAATTSTSATAGAATALPVTPAGYLTISLNGTNFKLPYFAV
jgi:hypothetical protein